MRCFVTSPCTIQAMKASGFGLPVLKEKPCVTPCKKKCLSERGCPHTPKVAGLVTHQSCYINWNWNPQFSFKPKYLQGQDHSLPYHPASLWRLSYLSKCNFTLRWTSSIITGCLRRERTSTIGVFSNGHVFKFSMHCWNTSASSLQPSRKRLRGIQAPAIHQSSSDSLSIPSAYKPYPLGVLLLGGRNMDLRCWESCGFLQWA